MAPSICQNFYAYKFVNVKFAPSKAFFIFRLQAIRCVRGINFATIVSMKNTTKEMR